MGKNQPVRKRPSPRALGMVAVLVGVLISGTAAFVLHPENASAAMDRGYYGAARGYFLEAAEDGDAKAQNSLGTRMKFLEAPQGLLPEKE